MALLLNLSFEDATLDYKVFIKAVEGIARTHILPRQAHSSLNKRPKCSTFYSPPS